MPSEGHQGDYVPRRKLLKNTSLASLLLNMLLFVMQPGRLTMSTIKVPSLTSIENNNQTGKFFFFQCTKYSIERFLSTLWADINCFIRKLIIQKLGAFYGMQQIHLHTYICMFVRAYVCLLANKMISLDTSLYSKNKNSKTKEVFFYANVNIFANINCYFVVV